MIQSNIFIRIICDAVLFLGIFFFPWWIVVFIALFGLFTFRDFIEIIIVASFMDIIFSPYSQTISFSSIIFTLSATIIYFVSPFLKQQLRFYNQS